MAISFNCVCGKVLRVGDEHAGKRVRCPVCNHISVAQAPPPQWEVVEDEPQVSSRVRAQPVGTKPRVKHDVEVDEDENPRLKDDVEADEDDDDRPRRKRRRDDDDDDEDDRPRRRKKKLKSKRRSKKEESSHFGVERGILNGGVAGGLLAMVIAVAWFIIGILNNWIFYYPPILFVLGFVALVKGMMGGDDDE